MRTGSSRGARRCAASGCSRTGGSVAARGATAPTIVTPRRSNEARTARERVLRSRERVGAAPAAARADARRAAPRGASRHEIEPFTAQVARAGVAAVGDTRRPDSGLDAQAPR